jgi:hypothetical protein
MSCSFIREEIEPLLYMGYRRKKYHVFKRSDLRDDNNVKCLFGVLLHICTTSTEYMLEAFLAQQKLKHFRISTKMPIVSSYIFLKYQILKQ